MSNAEIQILRDEVAELRTLIHNSGISDEWMSTKEASAYTKLSERTINRAVKRSVVKVSKKVGKNMFKRSWLDRWLSGSSIRVLDVDTVHHLAKSDNTNRNN
mgnify:CR=1 FL=1